MSVEVRSSASPASVTCWKPSLIPSLLTVTEDVTALQNPVDDSTPACVRTGEPAVFKDAAVTTTSVLSCGAEDCPWHPLHHPFSGIR
jgi:hypothetical protein